MAETKLASATRPLWPVIAAMGVTAFVLGLIGYSNMYASELAADPANTSKFYDVWDVIFGTFGLFVFNEPPWTTLDPMLNVARYLAFAATISAGATAVFALFSEQYMEWRLRRWRNHIVICGLGYKGFTFVQKIHQNDRVVVVESDPDNPTIEDCRALGVPVIIGDAQHDPVLRRAGVERAALLLAVCPDDAVNTEILLSARSVVHERRPGFLSRIVKRRGLTAPVARADGTLRCLAQISHPQLCAMLRDIQICEEDEAWTADFFNTDDTAATLVLDTYPVSGGDGPAHILVAHLGSLGHRLVVLAAQRWLSRQNRRTAVTPLVMTIIDDDADELLDVLKRQNAELRDEEMFTFITCSTSAKEVGRLKDRYADLKLPPPTRAYVTADEDDQGVAAALLLLSRLNLPTKVLVALSRRRGTGKVLDESPRVDVEVFAKFDKTCTPELLFDVSVPRLAREIHAIWVEEQCARSAKIGNAIDRLAAVRDDEAARALIEEARGVREKSTNAVAEAGQSEDLDVLRTIKDALRSIATATDENGALATIGAMAETLSEERENIKDPPTWEQASEEDRTSSMAQAHHIPAKLRSLDSTICSVSDVDRPELVLTEAEVNRLGVEEHARWEAERRNAGWSDGPKDKKNKTSPYLVPFGDLPDDVAEWDRVFVRKIPRILRRAGYKAVRNSQT